MSGGVECALVLADYALGGASSQAARGRRAAVQVCIARDDAETLDMVLGTSVKEWPAGATRAAVGGDLPGVRALLGQGADR